MHPHPVADLVLVFVLSVGLTLTAMNDLGWSWTVLLGVACASAIIGRSMAWVFGQIGASGSDAPLRAAD